MAWIAWETGASAPSPPVACEPLTRSRLKAKLKSVISRLARKLVTSQRIEARK
jgi:hypothetical protein